MECFDFFSVAEIKDTELAIKLAIINIIVIVNTSLQIFYTRPTKLVFEDVNDTPPYLY